jgi:hypothetical protein
MLKQTGVDGLRYSTLSPSTVKRKLEISSATARLRMIATKDFLNNAFKFKAGKDFVDVFITSALHGRDLRTARKKATRKKIAQKRSASGQSYANIARWQIQTGHSKLFPGNSLEVENLDSVERGRLELKREILSQIKSKGLIKAKYILGE